jgi:hypothetical protein
MGGWPVDKIIAGVLTWFANTVIGALNAVWDLLSATVFVSPDVTGLPQVTAFASTSLGIVNTCTCWPSCGWPSSCWAVTPSRPRTVRGC